MTFLLLLLLLLRRAAFPLPPSPSSRRPVDGERRARGHGRGPLPELRLREQGVLRRGAAQLGPGAAAVEAVAWRVGTSSSVSSFFTVAVDVFRPCGPRRPLGRREGHALGVRVLHQQVRDGPEPGRFRHACQDPGRPQTRLFAAVAAVAVAPAARAAPALDLVDLFDLLAVAVGEAAGAPEERALLALGLDLDGLLAALLFVLWRVGVAELEVEVDVDEEEEEGEDEKRKKPRKKRAVAAGELKKEKSFFSSSSLFAFRSLPLPSVFLLPNSARQEITTIFSRPCDSNWPEKSSPGGRWCRWRSRRCGRPARARPGCCIAASWSF